MATAKVEEISDHQLKGEKGPQWRSLFGPTWGESFLLLETCCAPVTAMVRLLCTSVLGSQETVSPLRTVIMFFQVLFLLQC